MRVPKLYYEVTMFFSFLSILHTLIYHLENRSNKGRIRGGIDGDNLEEGIRIQRAKMKKNREAS